MNISIYEYLAKLTGGLKSRNQTAPGAWSEPRNRVEHGDQKPKLTVPEE